MRRAEQLLYNALGVMRREPSNPYNDHRAFPSPRSLFPTEAFLVFGTSDETVTCRYDPYGHCLEAVGPPEGHPNLAEALAAEAHGSFEVIIASRFSAIPDYYENLRYPLALLEAGHCLYTLVLVAAALGLSHRVRLAFDDLEVRSGLCLPSEQHGWGVSAIVEFGLQPGSHIGATTPPMCRASSTAREDPTDGSLSFLERVEMATWLSGTEVTTWSAAAGSKPTGHGAQPSVETPGTLLAPEAPADPAVRSVAEVLYSRNSGRGVRGLSARSSVKVSAGDVRAALTEGLRSLPLDLQLQDGCPLAGIRIFLACERVKDLDDGLYEARTGDGFLVQTRRGPLLDEVQEAFSYPPASSVNVALLNVAWFLVVDYPQAINQWGPRGFRLANLEMGWIAQGIALYLASRDLFARPCRSYHEASLDTLLGLGPSETVGYEILCGANRFRDVLLDLRV